MARFFCLFWWSCWKFMITHSWPARTSISPIIEVRRSPSATTRLFKLAWLHLTHTHMTPLCPNNLLLTMHVFPFMCCDIFPSAQAPFPVVWLSPLVVVLALGWCEAGSSTPLHYLLPTGLWDKPKKLDTSLWCKLCQPLSKCQFETVAQCFFFFLSSFFLMTPCCHSLVRRDSSLREQKIIWICGHLGWRLPREIAINLFCFGSPGRH